MHFFASFVDFTPTSMILNVPWRPDSLMVRAFVSEESVPVPALAAGDTVLCSWDTPKWYINGLW